MKLYNLHTHQYTATPNIVELVNQYPWDFKANVPQYSIGIHPWHVDEERLATDLAFMDKMLSLPNCLAVGECGLDKRIDVPMALQTTVFEHQIALAEKHQKPLVLHLVAAFDELIEIKNRLKISVPIVIHGFSKNEQVAQQLIANGFYLSFGKYLLRNEALESVFQSVPNNRFFLETDTIEESLEEVYALAAQYKGITMTELKSMVASNWSTVFSK